MINKVSLVIVILIIMQFIFFDTTAQVSTLWLRNGKKVAITDYSLDTANYYEGKITFTNLNGKVKSKYKEDVFSVEACSGTETILYAQNVEMGEILTPERMKQYVIGTSDARITKISPMVLVGGLASGLAGAFIPQPELKLGDNTMPIPVGVLIPATYIGVMGATTPNADKLQQNHPIQATDEHYLMGYQEGVKKKRLKNSIIGAGVGFVAGIIVVAVIN
jgi:hypothetical protein